MADEFITHMAKAALIARIRQDRAEFAGLWKDLTPEQMTRRPGPQSDWSVKDLIAHMVFWENLMVGNIHKLLVGEPPTPSRDIDIINAEVFEVNKDRTLEDVLSEWDSNLARVEAAIAALIDEQINDPAAFSNQGGDPLLYHIIGNTFGHIGDHRADLLRYVESLKG